MRTAEPRLGRAIGGAAATVVEDLATVDLVSGSGSGSPPPPPPPGLVVTGM